MSTIRLKKITNEESVINFHVNLDTRGSRGYETDLVIKHDVDTDRWTAEMFFTDMPPQESVADAVDRLGLYLQHMSKAMRSKNVKHLNIDTLFKPAYK